HPCANIMAFLPEPRTCTLFRSITCDISASHFKYGVGSISTRNQAEGDRGGRKGESASVTKSNAVNSFQIKSSRPPFVPGGILIRLLAALIPPIPACSNTLDPRFLNTQSRNPAFSSHS